MQTIENWELLKFIIYRLGFLFQMALWGIFIYYLIISAFGWIRRKEESPASFPTKHTFAILVAAHNEESVIANIIKSLKRLKYPDDMYDIFVIADNCTDNTASIARANGALVYERTDTVKRGKGYSLEWMFKQLFEMDKEYDAVCVLDADNLVSSNFLMEMNKHLCMGHEVIQGYLDSKNPNDTWISGNNSIAFWISNRLIQLPRYYLGLSCLIGGTGFVTSTKVLKEIGWGATCLAEDLEYSLKLVLKGKKVYWAHDAIIYDEKPLKYNQSFRQRKRWMQGHFDCASRFLKKLVVKAIKDKDIVAMDCALYLFQPVIVVINGIGMIVGTSFMMINLIASLNGDYLNTVLYALFMFTCMYLSVMFVIMEGKFTRKIIKYLLLVPIYNLTWVPIILSGFKDRNKREWSHTLHTRSVDISEIEGLEKAS